MARDPPGDYGDYRPHPRRHGHRDSGGDLLPRQRSAYNSQRLSSPRHDRRTSVGKPSRPRYNTESGLLQKNKIQALNEQLGYAPESPVRSRKPADRRVSAHSAHRSYHTRQSSGRHTSDDFYHRGRRSRVPSGVPLIHPQQTRTEDIRRSRRHGQVLSEKDPQVQKRVKRLRRIIISVVVSVLAVALIIGLAVGLTVGKKNRNSSQQSGLSGGGSAPSSIPPSAQGTYLDPSTWYDTTDFNVTYTNETVGGLPIMGLNSTWDDNVRANPTVVPLTTPWAYGTTPMRGINVGGWLSTEPFIYPSLFNTTYSDIVNTTIPGPPYVDEWSLSTALGPNASAKVLEKHYATFVTADTFSAMRAGGFDHVRLPFPYWAVTTYPGDPYVPHISWRYLLRAIEYARWNGLRVNLDLHSAPGSQNGWNHSGKQGAIGWLNGTDGILNGQRTLQIHSQLCAFFAQPRYANLVTIYGILNEPNMIYGGEERVLNWTEAAITQIRASALPNTTVLAISDGFLPLPFWHSALPSISNASASRILLDSHEYVIFNAQQIALNHSAKLAFACEGWSQQAATSMNPSVGIGTFLCGEWSVADTDCGNWINGVNTGSRWLGNLVTDNQTTSVLTPSCPTQDSCDCSPANADPSTYTHAYSTWLSDNAEAQMRSFEVGWGWFYWTWDVEAGPGAAQWSWKKGVEGGFLPADVSSAATGLFNCDLSSTPNWVAQGLPESY